MKVILLKDVDGLGRKLDVKEVNDGYGRNFLLPRGLAQIATTQKLKELAVKKEKGEKEKQARISRLKEVAKETKNLKLEFKLRKGKKGEVFGSITKSDIKKSLQEKGVGEAEINLEHPLKKLGEHQVEINLGEGIKTKITVELKPL